MRIDEPSFTGRSLQKSIPSIYNNVDTPDKSYSGDTATGLEAWKTSFNGCSPGDAVIIDTPNAAHYAIALYAIHRGIHVLITPSAIRNLCQHQQLVSARKNNVFVYIEHNIRLAPAHKDAQTRAKILGHFNYF